MDPIPSLNHLCREAVSEGQYWRVQHRHVEASHQKSLCFLNTPKYATKVISSYVQVLNEDDAGAIVSLLIQRGALPPEALPVFSSCLTALHVRRAHLRNYGKWMSWASRLPYLTSLSLEDLRGAPEKVPINRLNCLVNLAPTLQSLVLTRCNAPITAIADVVHTFTSLTELRLTVANFGGE